MRGVPPKPLTTRVVRVYADGAQVADFFRRVQEPIAALPGVSTVGAGTGIPLEGYRSMSGIRALRHE
jgi:hypothetical protein